MQERKGFFVIKIWRLVICGLILLVTLSGCNSLRAQSVDKLGELSRNEFVAALRWKQWTVAANLMQAEHRQAFKKTFTNLPQLNITDVRQIDQQTTEGGRQFTTALEMDYYILPSVTVKTFAFDQTWLYFDGEASSPRGFRITTPFPPFP